MVEAHQLHGAARNFLARAKRDRAVAVARAYASGLSYGDIGKRLSISRGNARFLVNLGKTYIAEDAS